MGVTGDTGLGNANPFRYRGYYYDSETGLYYLYSRYYDPEIGRFINADDTDALTSDSASVNGKNLYAYCDNNPVNRKDNVGKFWLELGIMAVGSVIGGTISAVASVVTQKVTTGEINWKTVAVDAGSGFIGGAIAASPLGLIGQIVSGGIIGGVSYGVDCKVNNKSIDPFEMTMAVLGGGIAGYIGGAGANEYKALSNTIKTTKKVVVKETQRSSYKYSTKAIQRTTSWGISRLKNVAWSSSARYSVGTVVAKGFMAITSYARQQLLK